MALFSTLNLDEQGRAISTQIYYVLLLLTKSRALDKVQAAGESEGLHAWRLMHLQWEPDVKSRFVGMLMAILTAKFGDDVLAGIESWERNVREFEAQSGHQILDFIECGVLIMGMVDPIVKDHLVMHSARLET